jgi:2-dehydro-3-deoxygluconokinase
MLTLRGMRSHPDVISAEAFERHGRRHGQVAPDAGGRPVFDAVCVGESMVLLAPDPPQPLGQAKTLNVDVAGAESNVAVCLALMGMRSAWAGRIGADPLGEIVRDRIASYGVDVTLVVRDAGAPTGVFFKDPSPGRTNVHYYRRGSAASRMDRSLWNDVREVRTEIVHLSGVTAALSESCADLTAFALIERPVPGALMSFDVNYRPALWDAGRAAPILARLGNHADVTFVGLDEARTLWGTTTAQAVRELLPGPSTLVVKDGATGATSIGPGGTVFVPATPVEVVEPVGAGDAFAAGYLSGLLRGDDETDRLTRGHTVAGATLRVIGDIGVLPRLFTKDVHDV